MRLEFANGLTWKQLRLRVVSLMLSAGIAETHRGLGTCRPQNAEVKPQTIGILRGPCSTLELFGL